MSVPAASRVWTRSYESAAVPVSRRDQNCLLVVPRWSVGYSIHSSSRASSWFIPTRNALMNERFDSTSVVVAAGSVSMPGSSQSCEIAASVW